MQVAVRSFGSLEKWIKIEKKESPLERAIKEACPNAMVIEAENYVLADYLVVLNSNKAYDLGSYRWEQYYVEISRDGNTWTICRKGTVLGRVSSLEELTEFLKKQIQKIERDHKSRTIKLNGAYILTPKLVAMTKTGAEIITEEDIFLPNSTLLRVAFKVPLKQLGEAITITEGDVKIKLPLMSFWPMIQQGVELIKKWGGKYHVSVAINKTGARGLIIGPEIRGEPLHIKLGYSFIITVDLETMNAKIEYFDLEASETKSITAPLSEIEQFLNTHRELTREHIIPEEPILDKARANIEALVQELKKTYRFVEKRTEEDNVWILERGAGKLSVHLIPGDIPKIAFGFKWYSYTNELDRHLLPLESIYGLPPLNSDVKPLAETIWSRFREFVEDCRKIEKAVNSISKG